MGDGKKFFLAVDIGASSGRHIAGWLEDGEIKTEELYLCRRQKLSFLTTAKGK